MPPEDQPFTALSEEEKSSIRVLVIDDEATLRETCVNVLRLQGYNVTAEGRGEDALETVRRREYDIIIVDLYMTQVPGIELLRTALEKRPETIVVVMTGNPSVESNLEVLEAGAWDYLPKPFSATHVQVLKKVARSHASVFITGESGSGKELIANYIHHHSRRSRKPMVAVNCAALPEPLLESEMFGHAKGAFTGAVAEKKGLFEVANGGTLFLDELTEMSPGIQAKLLRVLQDGAVRRVGSTQIDAMVDVRIIAATNRDPRQAVEEGDLRSDLYYRLRGCRR